MAALVSRGGIVAELWEVVTCDGDQELAMVQDVDGWQVDAISPFPFPVIFFFDF